MRRDVADIGHRDRNYPSGRRAGGESCQCKLRQRGHHSANRHQNGPDCAGERHGPIFAEAIADGADHQLNRTMRHRIGGDDHGRDANRGMQIGRDLRQQRIHHPDLRLAGEAGDRQENDRARRRSVRARRRA
jgi:hypothetical protein